MEEKTVTVSPAMRRAIEKYEKKFERINCRLIPGTKQAIIDTGYSSVNSFIVDAIQEKLESFKKQNPETNEIPECFK